MVIIGELSGLQWELEQGVNLFVLGFSGICKQKLFFLFSVPTCAAGWKETITSDFERGDLTNHVYLKKGHRLLANGLELINSEIEKTDFF